VNVGTDPWGVAVNPDGKKVYVANWESSNVSVIDIATNTVTATVPVGYEPSGVAVNPAGTKVYVTHDGSDTVSVIDTATNTLTATVPIGSYSSYGVAVTPDGTKVYVTHDDSHDTVSVIDTATNTLTATVPIGSHSYGVAVNPNGKNVYVASWDTNNVSVIDTATNTVTATVPVGICPHGVAVNPDGTKVYVANQGSDIVSVIDTNTNEVTAKVYVGSYPHGVSVNSAGTKVYVANMDSDTVSVIDTATNVVEATVPVGTNPVAFGQFIVQEPVPPVADFSSNVTSGYSPLTVQFTDLSKDAIGRNWNFGDGTNSTAKNPTHKYSATGNYTVSLKATNYADSNTTTKANYIKVTAATPKPVAAFSGSPTSGNAPLNVTFTDKSTGNLTGWKWTFGDGTYSTAKNPTHKYSAKGNYTVALTATNAAGSNTTTKANYIKVLRQALEMP